MHIRPLAVALSLVAVACSRSNPSADADGGSSDTGGCPVGDEGCPCAENNSCGPGLVCASQMCVSEGDETSSSTSSGDSATASSGEASTGAVDVSTGSSSTTSSSTSEEASSTGWTTSGESTDGSSTSGTSTAPAPACGDGAVDDGEECDDGNVEPGDGCDDACTWEPWEHEGVAHDVPVADLHGWTPCWADDYSGTNDLLVSSLGESCDGANLLVACQPAGSDTLTLAAHAPREDVMFPVNYMANERHEANGVAWYWSPDHDHIGFGPAGNTSPCTTPGEDEQLCWRTQTVNSVNTFTFGRRCGAKYGFTDDEAPMWQRVVFQRG